MHVCMCLLVFYHMNPNLCDYSTINKNNFLHIYHEKHFQNFVHGLGKDRYFTNFTFYAHFLFMSLFGFHNLANTQFLSRRPKVSNSVLKSVSFSSLYYLCHCWKKPIMLFMLIGYKIFRFQGADGESTLCLRTNVTEPGCDACL